MENEKRLIDANALLEAAQFIEQVIDNRPYGTKTIYETVVTAQDIEDAPTVDAVEVVRCKDCKHWKCWRSSEEGTGDCLLDEGYQTLATRHYDFCSYGERREGDA